MSLHRDGAQQRINLTSASDQMLLELTREGFNEAFGELWRRHSCAALGAARAFTGYDPNDLMQEAFLKVYASITNGGNLPISFRAYIATTVRNLAKDIARRDPEDAVNSHGDSDLDRDDTVAEGDFSDRVLENSTTGQAFTELPTRHRELLWYRDVEDLPVQEIARYVGMTPNATTVAIKRAREAFKTAWIKVQLAPTRDLTDECTFVVSKLPAFARNKLPARESARIDLHLCECVHCAAVASEANALHKQLALALLPLLLFGGAPTYLTWIQSRKNRTPVPAAAHYLDVALSGIRHSPVVRGAVASPLAKTPRAFAVAAATATLLLVSTGAVALVQASLTGGTAVSTKQSQQETSKLVDLDVVNDWGGADAADDHDEPRAGHGLDVLDDHESTATLSWYPHGADTRGLTSTGTLITSPHPSANSSTAPSPGASGGHLPGPASPQGPPLPPLPQPVQPTGPEPVQPVDPEPEPPEPVTYPTPQEINVVVAVDAGIMGIAATPGATITIRISTAGQAVFETHLVANETGQAEYDFPEHRGALISVDVSQTYATADGPKLDPVTFTRLGWYIPIS